MSRAESRASATSEPTATGRGGHSSPVERDGPDAWRCTALGWTPDQPSLTWTSPGGAERISTLTLPRTLAFTVVGDRRCTGLWRGSRRVRCPFRAPVPAESTKPQCADCATADRRNSVAADTALDDPRPYHLYLAWFGPGLTKCGITAAERDERRLREQGALAHTWLGRGPLAAIRRAEISLGTALGVVDRFTHTRKLAAREGLRPDDDPSADLRTMHQAARTSPAWPDTLTRLPYHLVDHTAAYHYDRSRPPRATRQVSRLTEGAVIRGRLLSVVGPDAYLATGEQDPSRLDDVSDLTVLDLRLLCGWPMSGAQDSARSTAPTRPMEQRTDQAERAREAQPGLF